MPHRIQIRRDHPWQVTPKAIKVDRTTRWGNRYRVGQDGTAAECVALFAAAPTGDGPEADATYRAAVRAQLAGKTLACWCNVSDPCHADVLLKWASGEEP